MTHGIVKEQFLTNKSTFRRRRKRHVLKALLFILKCFQNFFLMRNLLLLFFF